jgi:hypothetical protein
MPSEAAILSILRRLAAAVACGGGVVAIAVVLPLIAKRCPERPLAVDLRDELLARLACVRLLAAAVVAGGAFASPPAGWRIVLVVVLLAESALSAGVVAPAFRSPRGRTPIRNRALLGLTLLGIAVAAGLLVFEG